RLQYHLGAMRYPIGNHGHPYTPELQKSDGKRYGKPVAHNPGEFDVALWNGVLAFQRDLAAGQANKVDPSLLLQSLTSRIFDPHPEAPKDAKQLATSMAYGDSAADDPIHVD